MPIFPTKELTVKEALTCKNYEFFDPINFTLKYYL